MNVAREGAMIGAVAGLVLGVPAGAVGIPAVLTYLSPGAPKTILLWPTTMPEAVAMGLGGVIGGGVCVCLGLSLGWVCSVLVRASNPNEELAALRFRLHQRRAYAPQQSDDDLAADRPAS
jgi:hypothetical protein